MKHISRKTLILGTILTSSISLAGMANAATDPMTYYAEGETPAVLEQRNIEVQPEAAAAAQSAAAIEPDAGIDPKTTLYTNRNIRAAVPQGVDIEVRTGSTSVTRSSQVSVNDEVRSLFNSVDADNSGEISFREYMAYHNKTVNPEFTEYFEFRAIDANSDEQISQAELNDAVDRTDPKL